MRAWRELQKSLSHGPAVLVSVAEVQGSGPREVGAWMAVTCAGQLIGTIGGGQLEFDAIARAHELLDGDVPSDETRRYALGPSLGQCCGGEMCVRFEAVSAADVTTLPDPPPFVFGDAAISALMNSPRKTVTAFSEASRACVS